MITFYRRIQSVNILFKDEIIESSSDVSIKSFQSVSFLTEVFFPS